MRRVFRIATLLSAVACIAPGAQATDVAEPVRIVSQITHSPLVLNQPADYVLDRVHIRGLLDLSALTLSGDIRSISITNSRFGQVLAGGNGQASAVLAQGANVGSFFATDCEFYDAENQLLSTTGGAFGHVVFERCAFRVSDSFLRQIVDKNPWRIAPPTTEFANIDRLELLDVEFTNTVVVIHPSVKQVIVRGQISEIQILDPGTQVIHLEDGQGPADIPALTLASTLG